MSSLFGGPGCFFLAILVFIVIGFQRGWQRELISLLAVLLASALIRPNTSDILGTFLSRIGAFFAFITGSEPATTEPVPVIGGPIWSLILFTALVAVGYFVGNRVFKAPTNSTDRFIGVIPAVLSGAFILGYLNYYLGDTAGQQSVTWDLASTDPAKFVPVIFMIGILAVVVAVIAARIKKAQKK
jgi:hypothetical protein